LKRIILASGSPRRQELLKLIGINFEVRVSSWTEIEQKVVAQCPVPLLDPRELCCYNATEKAKSITLSPEEDCIVIGCDTIVVVDKYILGKPSSKEDAKDMLSRLSGKTHTVCSGLSVIDNKSQKKITRCVETSVQFRDLSSLEIEWYVETGEPLDKAGSYGIQGRGALLIEKIDGCYYNVVGLPLVTLYSILIELGLWG